MNSLVDERRHQAGPAGAAAAYILPSNARIQPGGSDQPLCSMRTYQEARICLQAPSWACQSSGRPLGGLGLDVKTEMRPAVPGNKTEGRLVENNCCWARAGTKLGLPELQLGILPGLFKSTKVKNVHGREQAPSWACRSCSWASCRGSLNPQKFKKLHGREQAPSWACRSCSWASCRALAARSACRAWWACRPRAR